MLPLTRKGKYGNKSYLQWLFYIHLLTLLVRCVTILCTLSIRSNELEFELELIATLNYVGTHSYILPTLDLPAHAIHGGAQGSIYFNY